jgi:hypothetical protein
MLYVNLSFLAGILAAFLSFFGLHQQLAYHTPTSPPLALTAAVAAASPISNSSSVTSTQGASSALPDQSRYSQPANLPPATPERLISASLAVPTPANTYVTQDELNAQLLQLSNSLTAQFSDTPTSSVPQSVAAGGNASIPYAAENSINNLSNVTITNANLNASEIPNLSNSYLSLGGGTLTGGLNSSSTATTTFAAGMNILSGCFAIDGNCLTVGSFGGTLATNQGGTGTSTWQTGSIPFFNGTNFTENNNDLYWDNVNDSLGIGTTTPAANGATLTVVGNDPIETHSTSAWGLSMYVHNNNANGAPPINLYKSRGTEANPSAVQWCGSYECGDYLGYINFGGYDGSSYGLGAAIYASVDQNWTPTAHGSHLAIYFTRLGATTQNEMVQFGGKDASNVDGNDALFYWPLNFFSNSSTGVQLSPNGTGGLDLYRGDGSAGADLDILGSIGIGTTSPASVLSVSNTVSTTANTPLFTIASTTGGTSTSTLTTVLANGNVGIGTASPTSTVDVRSSDGNAVQLGLNPIDGDGYAIDIVRSNSF